MSIIVQHNQPNQVTTHGQSRVDLCSCFTDSFAISWIMGSVHLHVTFPSSSMKDLQQFQKPLPSLSKPVEVGFFSLSYVDETRREFHDDSRGLKTLFRRPSYPLSLNLKEGYDSYSKFDEGERMKEHLDHLLRWILLHPEEFLFYK